MGSIAEDMLGGASEDLAEQLVDVSRVTVSDAAREAVGDLGSRIGGGIARSVTSELSHAAGEATRRVAEMTIDSAEDAIVSALRRPKSTAQTSTAESKDKEYKGGSLRHTKMPQRCFKCRLALDADTVTWISDSRIRCPSCGTIIAVGDQSPEEY